jgi:hypothetical protein
MLQKQDIEDFDFPLLQHRQRLVRNDFENVNENELCQSPTVVQLLPHSFREMPSSFASFHPQPTSRQRLGEQNSLLPCSLSSLQP